MSDVKSRTLVHSGSDKSLNSGVLPLNRRNTLRCYRMDQA